MAVGWRSIVSVQFLTIVKFPACKEKFWYAYAKDKEVVE